MTRPRWFPSESIAARKCADQVLEDRGLRFSEEMTQSPVSRTLKFHHLQATTFHLRLIFLPLLNISTRAISPFSFSSFYVVSVPTVVMPYLVNLVRGDNEMTIISTPFDAVDFCL